MQVCLASCRDYKLEASASEGRKNEVVSPAVYLAVRTGVLVTFWSVSFRALLVGPRAPAELRKGSIMQAESLIKQK